MIMNKEDIIKIINETITPDFLIKKMSQYEKVETRFSMEQEPKWFGSRDTKKQRRYLYWLRSFLLRELHWDY